MVQTTTSHKVNRDLVGSGFSHELVAFEPHAPDARKLTPAEYTFSERQGTLIVYFSYFIHVHEN